MLYLQKGVKPQETSVSHIWKLFNKYYCVIYFCCNPKIARLFVLFCNKNTEWFNSKQSYYSELYFTNELVLLFIVTSVFQGIFVSIIFIAVVIFRLDVNKIVSIILFYFNNKADFMITIKQLRVTSEYLQIYIL